MTLSVPVFHVNAFTHQGQGGNPAGVVVSPTKNLSDPQQKQVAKTVGFSETAFVHPSEKADLKVRFFTPSDEVDFCGHATVATFHLLHQLKKLLPGTYRQETGAGVLPVEITPDGAIWMDQTSPQFGPELPKSEIAASLNISEDQLAPDLPVQVVSTGLPDILVPVKDRATLEAIQPDFDAVSKISQQHDVVGYHLFCLEPLNPKATAHCRNLAPRYGIPEESATGSATGALASYLVHHGKVSAEQAKHLTFEQGYTMGRPSEILAQLDVRDGQIQRVRVGGVGTTTGEQTIPLEA